MKLPQCQRTLVLTTAGGFPDNWARLSAKAQASHPINLPMMQVCADAAAAADSGFAMSP